MDDALANLAGLAKNVISYHVIPGVASMVNVKTVPVSVLEDGMVDTAL